jgi:hypothetical protein
MDTQFHLATLMTMLDDDAPADVHQPTGKFLALQQNQTKALLHKLVVTRLYKPRWLPY